MIEQQLFAQNRINGIRQGGALARTKAFVVAKKSGHNRIGGMVEHEGEPDEFSAGIKQSFRMHSPLLSSAPCSAPTMTSPLHTASPSLTPEMIAAPLSPMDPSVQVPPGLYRHYKGRFYQVLGTARHSESLEPMTVYRALYGEHGLWVRPAAMFAEEITIDGVPRQRFQRVEDGAPVF